MKTLMTPAFAKVAVAVLLGLPLVGCGGGSSSGSEQAESLPQERTLTNLAIARENNLGSTRKLSVTVDMSSDRSYLSICPSEGQAEEATTMSYDSCILRSPLSDGRETMALDLPNHIDSLVAVVWFYESNREPLTMHWDRPFADNQADLRWFISESELVSG